MQTQPDAELIAATLRGDISAFRQFYDRHVDAVFGRAMSALHAEEDAREITQETFALAFRKLRGIRLVEGSAKPWLLRSCANLVATHNRTAGRRPVTVDVTELDDSMTEADATETIVGSQLLLEQLRGEVAGMPFIDQEIFRLVLVEERSYQQAAEALQLSLASVRKRVNRVRTRLRIAAEGQRDG